MQRSKPPHKQSKTINNGKSILPHLLPHSLKKKKKKLSYYVFFLCSLASYICLYWVADMPNSLLNNNVCFEEILVTLQWWAHNCMNNCMTGGWWESRHIQEGPRQRSERGPCPVSEHAGFLQMAQHQQKASFSVQGRWCHKTLSEKSHNR